MNPILEKALSQEQKKAFHELTTEVNRKIVHGSLFSGIGGFDLAAQWMGWENAFHCEWNPFGQRILKHYWPEAVSYGDITKTDFTIWRGRIDILTGGFPCQPYSTAGKRKGTEDERHLWPEYLRAIREIRPRYVVGENVSGLVNWSGGMVFEQVQTDLENEGYEVFPFIIPAAGVGAPHRRDRIWFVARLSVADPNDRFCKYEKEQIQTRRHAAYDFLQQSIADPLRGRRSSKEHRKKESRRIAEKSISRNWEDFPVEPPIRYGNDGVPFGLDGITIPQFISRTITAGGNAVVPQIPHMIFKAINEFEKLCE